MFLDSRLWNLKLGIANLHFWYYLSSMTTISLKIPEELVSRMDAMAKSKRTSRSALLREALEEKLKTMTRKTPLSLYEQSADLCGKGKSGLRDLASNPKHLEGFGQ
jgi:Arc/MetJ-type ribon-helix-helix transcriptional regulator